MDGIDLHIAARAVRASAAALILFALLVIWGIGVKKAKRYETPINYLLFAVLIVLSWFGIFSILGG